MPHTTHPCPVERITNAPFRHFFGYYEKTPWDAAGSRLLGMRVTFQHRPPTARDTAQIGFIDTTDGNRWRPLAETAAWCWQQSCMLQWLGSDPAHTIIFNTSEDDHFVAVILDVETGAHSVLPHPVYAVDNQGRYAMSLNFARLDRTRPGYGYKGVDDPTVGQNAPDDDGVYHIDLRTGKHKLVISLAQLAALRPHDTMRDAEHWVNHLQCSRSGQRFAMLHRWRQPGQRGWYTRLLTADPQGNDIAILADEGYVSHYDWRGDDAILAWARHNDERHYHLYTDGGEHVRSVGAGVLTVDGHCSYSPDGRWILTDTYPDPETSARTLILYRPDTYQRIDIGQFYAPPELNGEIRCDLHPRWNRDGTAICIDSAHEETRQMYVIDVAEVVNQ
ncbi:MAG: hypothetical protein R2873_28460 [Caldilineaceae bacterium]